MPIVVYLAARYSRRYELQEYAKELQALGFSVSSQWLWRGNDHVQEDGSTPEEIGQLSFLDGTDIEMSDAFILFSEVPRQTAARGGRLVEFGLALSEPTRLCVVVGPMETIYHYYPGVVSVSAWGDAKAVLVAWRERGAVYGKAY